MEIMIPGFKTKKIKAQETLGDVFKKARQEKQISLTEAETETKVRVKFLVALEDGRWDILPSVVYTRGFVLAYARFLELDSKGVLKLFDGEVSFYEESSSKNLSYKQSVQEAKVLVTPRVLAYVSLVLLVIAMVSYIFYQVAGFAGSPNLKINTPADNVIVESDRLQLAGVTDNDAVITVNGEGIPVANDGHFAEELKLHRGVNILSVKAVNKAQKESSQVYTVEYRPKTADVDVNAARNNF